MKRSGADVSADDYSQISTDWRLNFLFSYINAHGKLRREKRFKKTRWWERETRESRTREIVYPKQISHGIWLLHVRCSIYTLKKDRQIMADSKTLLERILVFPIELNVGIVTPSMFKVFFCLSLPIQRVRKDEPLGFKFIHNQRASVSCTAPHYYFVTWYNKLKLMSREKRENKKNQTMIYANKENRHGANGSWFRCSMADSTCPKVYGQTPNACHLRRGGINHGMA